MSSPDRVSAPAATADPALSGKRVPRRELGIALAAAVLWLLALGGLALFTANPVTLNVEQIRASDYVVTGRLSEREHDVIVVERKWKGGELPAEFSVRNLSQTSARPGRTYVVPLSRMRSAALQVTETDLPENPPLVYPETEEAIAQLTAILPDDSAAQSNSASGSAPER